MVNKVVPHEELNLATKDWLKKSSRMRRCRSRWRKEVCRNFSKMDLGQALDYEAHAIGICVNSEDRVEGFKAFLEKREPNFLGK